MLQFLAQCAACKSTFDLGPGEVHKAKADLPNGKSIWVTYFDCPICGRTHFVQIDDVRTNMLLAKIGKVFASVAKAKRCGHNVQKQSAKYHRINRDLDALRKDLKEEYSGVTVQMEGFDEPQLLLFEADGAVTELDVELN